MHLGPLFALLVLGAIAALGCERVQEPETLAFVEVRTWELPEPLGAVALSRDAGAIALGSATGESSLWNAPWKLSVIFDRSPAPLLAAGFGADDHLLFARADGSVQVLASNGAVIQEARFAAPHARERAAFSDSGAHVAFGGQIYALTGERAVAQASTSATAASASFAGDRAALIVDAGGRELVGLALEGGTARKLLAPSRVTAGAISGDGHSIAAGTAEGALVWQGDEPEPTCRYATSEAIDALTWSGSASWFALTSGRTLQIVRARDCERIASLRTIDRSTSLVAHEDLIAAGDASGRVYVFDVYNARWLAREQVFDAPVLQVQLHASSRSVLAAANRGQGAKAKLLQAMH
jgi:hypothetical protein